MPNAWVEHTRKFAKDNNMSYACAVSDPKNKSSYHAQKPAKAKAPTKAKAPAKAKAEAPKAKTPTPKAKTPTPKAEEPKAKKSMPDDIGKLIQDFARPTGTGEKPYQQLSGNGFSVERYHQQKKDQYREKKYAIRKSIVKNDEWFIGILRMAFGGGYEYSQKNGKELLALTAKERFMFVIQYWDKLTKTTALSHDRDIRSNFIKSSDDATNFVELEDPKNTEEYKGQRYRDEPVPMKKQYWDERVSPIDRYQGWIDPNFFDNSNEPKSLAQLQKDKKWKEEHLLKQEKDAVIHRQYKEAEKKKRDKEEADKKEAKRLERNKKAREARLKKK